MDKDELHIYASLFFTTNTQLGYVEMDGQLQVQICPGDPSPTDTSEL